MTYSAAAFAATSFSSHVIDPIARLELARYRGWLDEAYASATSDAVRALITEVYQDLQALAAAGAENVRELGETIVGALASVLAALDTDQTAVC